MVASSAKARQYGRRNPMIKMTTLVVWFVGVIVVVYAFGVFVFLKAHLPSLRGRQRTLLDAKEDTNFSSAVYNYYDLKSDGRTSTSSDHNNLNAPGSSPTFHPTNTPFPTSKPKKYIMFIPIKEGQGIGNIMNGLLAAHLFGEEFNRRVCVSTQFEGFHKAFEPVEAGFLEECSKLPQEGGQQIVNAAIVDNAMVIFNFGVVPDECALKDLLASPTELLFYCGNTYPRWPVVPENFFSKLYRPRKQLLTTMPWKIPPETVVHLRAPDTIGDRRVGLDDETLRILGETLPHDTFLVTNKVAWYEMFESKYGWSHPEWEEISHTAMAMSWGARNMTKQNRTSLFGLSSEDVKSISVFCDWFTISQAKHVVHTHSDFSLSAIHFMNILNSQTILGSENGALTLIDESWRRDGETARLVDRTGENLRLCQHPSTTA